MLSIQTYTSKDLSRYIKSFWRLEVPQHLNGAYTEDILPDGHHEIIFHLNSSASRKLNGGNDWQNDPATFFAGQNSKSYLQQLQPGAVIYAVRFHPHTQALFYNFPASLTTDNLIDFAGVTAKDDLPACIDESPGKTFTRLEKEFSKRIYSLNNPCNVFLYVEAAVNCIIREKGNVKMERLEKITGVSSRYLEKSFQQWVGISPKQFCNIIKYSQFINYKKNNPSKTLTECAYESEFTDQSHLVRLSNLITGQSPKNYFNRQNHINNFFLEA